MDISGFILVVSVFLVVPLAMAIVMYKMKKNEEDTKRLHAQKEILELEIEKQRNQLKLLETENRNLDKAIEDQ
ncbi:MAG: hypothetical protein LBK63_11830 [Treponema sp.]|jgi:type III secretory pathway component EscR|nr:hypothetical protein [Treponema sp.]